MPTILYFALSIKLDERSWKYRQSVHQRAKKSPEIPGTRGDEWIRTTDSRIFSPMLYQLSYITAFVKSVAKVDI